MNNCFPGVVKAANFGYWREQIKCQYACPVHTDARGYIRAIADGNDELAYLIARGPNPLASICGKICGAPCEKACRRGDYDAPISIRRLKNYVCEQYGPESGRRESGSLIEFLKTAARKYAPRQCQDRDELLPLLQSLMQGNIESVENMSVGVIGSGPAGLAAAHDLALYGFQVVIYEMEPVLAGMLAVGVPEYRLPRQAIQAEVDVILGMGVQAITNCQIGKDILFPELRRKHNAVVIAVGAKRSRSIPIPGADAAGVIGGVEFLRDASLGNAPALGDRVVVIGGGNVAYDVGRTVLRQISMDAARTARRTSGVRDVYLCSLESLEEMPADDIEIIEGDEEGIHRRNSLGPMEIHSGGDGQVTGVKFKRCLRVYNEERRFDPRFDENETTVIPCDNVIVSIGQTFDLSFLNAERDRLEFHPNGAVVCDPETGRTNCPDVYIAGDLAYGAKLLIHAVASGKAAARSIYESVTGRKASLRQTELHFPLTHYYREEGYEKQKRIEPPKTDVAQRLQSLSNLVECRYTEEQARREAGRCLDCGINTIFDGTKCILCGGCVDVCPELCLRIVSVSLLVNQVELQPLFEAHMQDFPLDQASAILKDETRCIRCALCAERCPTGAITMERFHFEVMPICLTA
ncbi:MAG: FAD-dependent oxidoreductase [Candidatus Omnitrophota bacterium]